MTALAKDSAKFLKSTLRLPTSKFPPRPRPADLPKYLLQCTDNLYAWQRQERSASDTFILHDGPPYANGDLHAGHALNKIIKDIICRYKLAQGQRVDYVPGWDCHGLPIEIKAIEKMGWAQGEAVDPVAIRTVARKFAYKTVEKQMATFQSWAVMGDWKNHWKTMQKDFELRQLEVFQAMVEYGLILRKNKPVYWSPSSRTALAEAELEYDEDHISTAAFVKFPVTNTDLTAPGPIHFLVWTTTPWTLPANQAIALNSSLQYCLVKSTTHGLLILVRSRVASLETHIKESVEILVESLPMEKLLQSTYSGLSQFGAGAANRPVFHANFVAEDSGTGVVHCAPGHGMEDYEALQTMIETSRVSVKAPVDNHGRFDGTASPENPELLAGLNVFDEGNAAVLKMLQAANLLVDYYSYKHKYPIDWRTKKPIIIRATAQWFADVSKIKADALHSLEAVAFLPDSGKARLKSFIANRSEWCISRQRAWGVPIPALYQKSTGEAILTSGSIGHIMKVIEQRGIDAWWADAPDDSAWILPGLPGSASDYVRGMDTMDVWFDSGTSWSLMRNGALNQSKPLADLYLEGSDQHRGWFQSSLLTNIAYQKSLQSKSDPASPSPPRPHAPFSTLVTHGFTLDGQGKKMSKSLGNVIAPSQIISGFGSSTKQMKQKREAATLGPDALRLWVASSDWTTDVVVSETVVTTVHSMLDKYRLTIRLLLGMLSDFDPHMMIPYDSMSQVDQLALLHLHRVVESARNAYASLDFHKAHVAISRWMVRDLSGFYIEAVKDIVYCDALRSTRRLSAQTTLHHILSHLQQMIGPVTPLLVEESWEHSSEKYKKALDHPLRSVWNPLPKEWDNPSLAGVLPPLMAIRTSVRASQEVARGQKLIGSSLGSDVVVYLHEEANLSRFSQEDWKELLVVSDVQIKPTGQLSSSDIQSRSDSTWSFANDIVLPESDHKIGTVMVTSPSHLKCDRCWKYVVEVPENGTEGEGLLCERCTDAIKEFPQ